MCSRSSASLAGRYVPCKTVRKGGGQLLFKSKPYSEAQLLPCVAAYGHIVQLSETCLQDRPAGVMRVLYSEREEAFSCLHRVGVLGKLLEDLADGSHIQTDVAEQVCDLQDSPEYLYVSHILAISQLFLSQHEASSPSLCKPLTYLAGQRPQLLQVQLHRFASAR